MTTLETDILALSSGTIAALTGYRNYGWIDYIHREFFAYARRGNRSWRNWQDAWRDFDYYLAIYQGF